MQDASDLPARGPGQAAAALEAGITGLPFDDALRLVDVWHAGEDLGAIGEGLGELRDLLAAGALPGARTRSTAAPLPEGRG